MGKYAWKGLVGCLLSLVMAFSPVLSLVSEMQVQAAESRIWYHVEAGSGNGNSHQYSDASTSPAAVLLYQEETMPLDGEFSVTYEKQGNTAGARLGFFYTYLDDDNWLYVGYDSSSKWFYEYKLNGSGSYASISGLPSQEDGSRVKFSVALSHETLMVSVNDSRASVPVQNLYTLATQINGRGKFGFRAASGTSFRFINPELNKNTLGDNWAFLANCQGQTKEEDRVSVYTVTGSVYDAGNNTPIEGAAVRIGEESTRTNAQGSFSVDVEEGVHDVSVSAKGYLAKEIPDLDVHENVNLQEPVKLTKRSSMVYDKYIQNGTIQAAVSKTFPQVYQYKLNVNGTEKTFSGQELDLSVVEINGTAITPVMGNVQIKRDHAIYPMTLKNEEESIDLSMTVKISLSENDLIWEVTEIKKQAACAKINTIEVPNLNLVTIMEGQSDAQFMGANVSIDTNVSGDHEITFEEGFTPNVSQGYAYGFLSADGVSAGVWSNSEMLGDRRLMRNNGADSISLTSAAWYYDYNDESGFRFSDYDTVYDGSAAGGIPVSALPCAKVCLTGDENQDGIADWQDGAIAYRDIMNNPYGSENTKDLVNYRISMNFSSQATNPYLKVADSIKRVYLATDGLPQAVMMKGYGSEGHDSANSEYGYVAERLGGLEELKQLNTIAHQYNTQMGIHINAQEAYPEAQTFSDYLINGPGQHGWGWLDQSYTINRAYDLGTGLRYKRLLQLYDQLNSTSLYSNKWPGIAGAGEDETVADAATIKKTVAENLNSPTDLDFMYLDVWYGNSWETRKIAQQFNSLGWRFSTEFCNEGEYDSTWQHWATEGHYGGSSSKGLNSDVIRFIRNHQKDSFVLNYPCYGGTANNPLLGGYDLSGFEGWGSSNDSFNDYLTTTFLSNLPTKFLQHYKVYKWENYAEDETIPTGFWSQDDGYGNIITGESLCNHEKKITLKSDDGKDTVVVTRNTDQIPSNTDSGNQTLNYVERKITLNGKEVLNNAHYLLPWVDSETKEEKLYHYNYEGGETTWELQDDWANLENVKLYTLTDTGRADEKVVPVTNGSIVLTAEPNTPYVVVKGTSKAPAKTITKWSNSVHVTDTGFNSYASTEGGTALNTEFWTGDTEEAKVVKVGTGNKYLQMGSDTKAQKVSTAITDLKPGRNYVAQIYVDNKSDAKAWLKVTGGTEDVSAYTLRSIAENYVQSDAHNRRGLSGSCMQIMQVAFTAKTDTAVFTLEREAGSGITYFDDIRVVEKTTNNIQSDGTFVQDFESVVSGFYPFVMGPAQGVQDQVTHLSERHEPYTQSGWGNVILDDVIEGDWSLKYHRYTGEQGILYRTIPQNLHFEAGGIYEVSFDYQAGCDNSFYVVTGDGTQTDQNVQWLTGTAAPAKGGKSTTNHHSFVINAAESGQSWFGIATVNNSSASGSYGGRDFILDNLKVKCIASITPAYINASSAKEPVELTVNFGDDLNDTNAVMWSSSDEGVAKVVPDADDSKKCKVYLVGEGNAEISAATTVDFENITLKSRILFVADAEESGNMAANAAKISNERKAALISALAVAKTKIDAGQGSYDDTSWKAFETAYQEADSGKNSSDAEELLRLHQALSSAQNSLVITLDSAQRSLETEVNQAGESYNKGADGFTAESWKAFKDAYENAQNVSSANAAQIVRLQQALAKAKANLMTKDQALAKELQQMLEITRDIREGGQRDYTLKSWEKFVEAYDAAENGKDSTDTAVLTKLKKDLEDAQSSFETNLQDAEKKMNSALSSAKMKIDKDWALWTDESWTPFMDAYLKAQKALYDESTADTLLLYCDALIRAEQNLVTKEAEQLKQAQEKLNTALTSAAAVKNKGQQNYTNPTWQAFIAAYNEAEAGKNSTDVSELIRLATALTNAQKALEKKSEFAAGRTAVAGDVLYKVTDATKKTVIAVNGTNKNGSTSITIQSAVAVDGVTCTVTEINANAFKGFKKLKKVTIGSNVTKVGKAAFSGCKNLKTIKIQSKTLKTFSKKALKGTSTKLTVKVPKKMNPAKLRSKLIKQIKTAGNKKVKVK